MGHKVPGDGEGLNYLVYSRKTNHRLREDNSSDNAGVESVSHKWCTISCEHAGWPKDNIDGSKSCRTFAALWCKELQAHVTKNTPCALEHGQRRPKPNW
jgi:hypothetical protein